MKLVAVVVMMAGVTVKELMMMMITTTTGSVIPVQKLVSAPHPVGPASYYDPSPASTAFTFLSRFCSIRFGADVMGLLFDTGFPLSLFVRQVNRKRTAINHTRTSTASLTQKSMIRFLYPNRQKNRTTHNRTPDRVW